MNRIFSSLLIMLVLAWVPRLSAGEHPVPLEKNVDAAKCLECHEDKTKGEHVHTAISMGCTSCHEVKVDKDTTFVELNAPKEELCFSCHEKSKAQVQHGPYAKGGCVLCHDPHVTEFDNHLRAEGNALCLECHLDRRVSGDPVQLFKASQLMPASDFAEIPKIGLDPTLKFGHPMGNHKVAGAPDLLHPGKTMTCLTCHENHASTREKLVRDAELSGKKMDVCDACHLTKDNASMAEAQKRMDQIEAQRQKEDQARSKQPIVTPQKAPQTGKKNP
jgi:predicted CXXCH cytochrome family protein